MCAPTATSCISYSMSNLSSSKEHFFFPQNQPAPLLISVRPPSIFADHSSLCLEGSKSETNRGIVLSGMSSFPTTLTNFLFAEDSFWGLLGLEQLGFHVSCNIQNRSVHIDPLPLATVRKRSHPIAIHLGKSGTLARFFIAVVLNWQKTFPQQKRIHFYLHGEEQLTRRPLAELCTALKELHADMDGDGLPLHGSSSDISGNCSISGKKSGQFLSGLLLTAAGSQNEVHITRTENLVQPGYIDMTLHALLKFGCTPKVSGDKEHFLIQHTRPLQCPEFKIEPDASTACYFIALAFLHNFNLTLEGLGHTSVQPDLKFIPFLQRMGAHIEVFPHKICVYKRAENTIQGGFSYDFSQMSDQSLTAAVVALFCAQPIHISGISHIQYHESKRLDRVCDNLKQVGARVEKYEDGLSVCGPFANQPAQWKTWNDHRFAFCGSVLSSLAPSISVEDPTCVEKTCPHYFSHLESLGFQLSHEVYKYHV